MRKRRSPASMGLKMGFDDVADNTHDPVHIVNVNVSEFEATHKRATIWLRDDVYHQLAVRSKKRGDKTRIVNQALLNYFAEMDAEK